MGKLSVFSKKLNRPLELQVAASVGSPGMQSASWSDKGWSNSYGSWLDKGWSNSYGSWTDKGWSNSDSHWVDKGWSNSHGSWSDVGWSNSGSGPCYISTACVQHKGLPDDCYELETLRRFRDELCAQDESLRDLFLHYYRKAPLVLAALDSCPDRERRFECLYDGLVLKCVRLLEAGKAQEALGVYRAVCADLEREFLSGSQGTD